MRRDSLIRRLQYDGPSAKAASSLRCNISYVLAVKQIVAIIKPYLAQQVLEGLRRAPLEAINVKEVKGYGRQKSYLDQYQDSEYSEAFLPKVEISMWVDDARVDEVLEKVVAVARSGRMGDGKIFVMPVSQFF